MKEDPMSRTAFLASGAFLVFLAAVTGADVADHVFFIDLEMTYSLEHGHPGEGVEYEFLFEIQTDNTVQRVEVLTPTGRTFEFLPVEDYYDSETGIWTGYDYDEDEQAWVWEYEHAVETAEALAALYGDGDYRITVIYEVGAPEWTVVWFGVPGTQLPLAQPTQPPMFVHPQHRTSVDSPVMFQWEPCVDPAVRALWVWTESMNREDEFECDSPLAPSTTSWGPIDLADGYWNAGLVLINGYHPILDPVMVNPDGIPYAVVKISETEIRFLVGRPWSVYEVWGGDEDFLQEPEWWRYYQAPGAHGYTLLGVSEDGRSGRFDGNYAYYVILAHEPVRINCLRGSDGSYYQGHLATTCVDNWGGLLGSCDQQYAILGANCSPGMVRITNPGGAWAWFRVITDQCPWADLSGDCFVDLADLAIVAEQWLTGVR